MTPELAVVIPAYNESKVLSDVVHGVRAHAADASVVVVDDGSTDETATVAHAAGATVVRHPVNLGQGAAIHTGMRFALDRGAHYVCTFDADGQHDPTSIPYFFNVLRSSNVDVVLGSRFLVEGQRVPPLRRLTLALALVFTRAHTRLDLTDTHNGLRMMTRRAAERMLPEQSGMAHASEMLHLLAKHKLRWREEPTRIRYDSYSVAKGQSSLNSIKIVLELFYRAITRP